MDWTAGYVAEIDYTHGYYSELNPLRSKLPLLYGGFAPPQSFATACELGFGQGVSVNIHAAATPTQWYGNDFNPAQAGFARELAAVSGSQAQLTDEAFAEFCNRTDLPEFDFIGLHGIWSWISDVNRGILVDFFRRKLKVGGIVYLSYNTLPGWAHVMPVRHLLTQHASIEGSAGQGVVGRIDRALAFGDKLFALNPAYSRMNPSALERFNGLKAQSRNYLAHEYFNQDWHPMHYADMAKWLGTAKLSYAGSANYHDHVGGINFTPEQQGTLDEIRDPVFKETVRDYIINQQFRRDYWIKGARKLPLLEQAEQIRAQRILLTTPAAAVERKIKGPIGEASLQEAIYQPLLECLADNKTREIGELVDKLKTKNLAYNQIVQAVLILAGKGDVVAVQDEKNASKSRSTSDRLNSSLATRARAASDIQFLASPVTGGGIGVPRFQQLFMLAKSQGQKTPDEWAKFVWTVISSQGQKLVKEGKVVESEAESLAEISRQAKEFADVRGPAMRALGFHV